MSMTRTVDVYREGAIYRVPRSVLINEMAPRARAVFVRGADEANDLDSQNAFDEVAARRDAEVKVAEAASPEPLDPAKLDRFAGLVGLDLVIAITEEEIALFERKLKAAKDPLVVADLESQRERRVQAVAHWRASKVVTDAR